MSVSGRVKRLWRLPFRPQSISISSTRLLVTSEDTNELMQLDIMAAAGHCMRRIQLPPREVSGLLCAVESPTTGTFIITHKNKHDHTQVCSHIAIIMVWPWNWPFVRNCRGEILLAKTAGFKRRDVVPSVLWRCWLGGRKGIRPVENWVVGCWRGCLGWSADLHIAQQMPLPFTVSCSSKSRLALTFLVFTFLVPAHPGGPGQIGEEQ